MFDPSEVVGGRINRNHNLNRDEAGNARMFFVGEMPWHTLGTRLDRPATSKEAIEAAKLDYKVRTVPLVTRGDEGVTDDPFAGLAVPSFGVVREDTKAVLGVVGPGWRPVQNTEAFGFLDAVAADAGIEYHTAGAIGRGERIWALVKLPGLIRVGDSNDTVEKFLLLSNSHDGRSALRVLWTPQRVVCQNTMAVALRDGDGQGLSVRHVGDLPSKINEARRVLGLANRFYDALPPVFDALAAYRPTRVQLESYFKALYPDPVDEAQERAKANAEKTRETLFGLFETGIGHDQPGIQGSAWAAVNAVVEHVDHVKLPRGYTKGSEVGTSRKLESMWWGDGASLKREAWSLALEMAEVG